MFNHHKTWIGFSVIGYIEAFHNILIYFRGIDKPKHGVVIETGRPRAKIRTIPNPDASAFAWIVYVVTKKTFS